MSGAQLRTPVAFLVFNRPEPTRRVFERIAAARPPKLLVVADGPRPGRPGEAERCAEVRDIVSRVDWDCEVVTNFADANLGCRRRVASGLDWVFASVEEAIVLEDDCLPDPSFFRFAQELLARFRDDERVGMISGDNFQAAGRPPSPHSYYFSHFCHIWGWATWRRAWRHYDVDMALWPAAREAGLLEEMFHDRAYARWWSQTFDRVHAGEIDTWDYQWVFSCWSQRALAVGPESNLVSNIGFGSDATHTRRRNSTADLAATAVAFPLRHPPFMIRDERADAYSRRRVLRAPGALSTALRIAYRTLAAP